MKLREPNCDGERDRLAQRMAKLEETPSAVMERNSQLEEENARLHRENARLHAEVERLGKENARLQQQLAAAHKDSSTSSKPPSSDLVRPKKPLPKDGTERKKGGQPGHEQHVRSPFPPEAVNHFEPLTRDCHPDCGGGLVLSGREKYLRRNVAIVDLLPKEDQ